MDIFDIMEMSDFVIRVKNPDECQLTRADLPTGTVPYCNPPDEIITVADLMVVIDMALNRADCCTYYYTGIFY